ncbi:MAG: DNA replication/repair protein RecF [Bacilli bacterium]|jgi:DNA replication and repair protein RecF|nr:DNA replication/repair protein RecF [Bacilli bacterium]
MIFNNLKLINFRNIDFQELFFCERINLFIGNNAQGKTNLLEALYLLSFTKSFKTNNLKELINFKANNFFLEGKLSENDFIHDITFFFEKNKEINLDNNKITKLKSIFGLINIVLFVPEDLFLIKGSPSNRRKLLDIELSKIDQLYLDALANYYYVLKQRNIYLKRDNIDNNMLDVFDKQLIKYGLIIYELRTNFINEINALVNKYYLSIANDEKDVLIKYHSSFSLDNSINSNLFFNSRNKDIQLHQTNNGIHRDDIIFYLNGNNASEFASQGEQRSIVLSLKLALLEYIYLKTNNYPIFLLDDVLSELDNNRQENLIRKLNNNIQTFITCTSLHGINKEFIRNSYLFKVNNGQFERMEINE